MIFKKSHFLYSKHLIEFCWYVVFVCTVPLVTPSMSSHLVFCEIQVRWVPSSNVYPWDDCWQGVFCDCQSAPPCDATPGCHVTCTRIHLWMLSSVGIAKYKLRVVFNRNPGSGHPTNNLKHLFNKCTKQNAFASIPRSPRVSHETLGSELCFLDRRA